MDNILKPKDNNKHKQIEQKEPSMDKTEGVEDSFPIVGIGASAGGLKALEDFLKNVPADSGMAFIIIQHLDPIKKEMLTGLLQRTANMPVHQVEDGVKVKPNYVYVIPPDKDMSIFHGALYLLEPIGAHGLQLPIDFFFRSLAEDQREKSIGVILSGMGTDGNGGIRTIKEKAGLVLVQNPTEAKYHAMPSSAIKTGMVDIIAPVKDLPGKIIDFYQRLHRGTKSREEWESNSFSVLEKIAILLRTHSGNDFSLYKSNTIYRRVERRMGIHQIDKINNYIKFLQENPQELELLFKELLIGVTSFFRDATVWEEMKKRLTSYLIDIYPARRSLRAWVPSCSTGEEAYSLAMLFKEVVEDIHPQGKFTLQIFATDLDKDSIHKARQGFYPENIAMDVSEERLERFFIKEENGYRICNEIREMIIFAPQNVIADPPFTKLDILSCRNLLIYLNAESQKKLIDLFHYSLKTNGLLLLGSAETIGSNNNLFVKVEGQSKLYKRLEMTDRSYIMNFPLSGLPDKSNTTNHSKVRKLESSLQSSAERLILKNYSPALVLVNQNGDILYINGKTGKYLEPATGKVNWNIFAMAREDLQYELTRAFWKALREKSSITINNINISVNDRMQEIKLVVQYLKEPEELQGMLVIIFRDQEKQFVVKTQDIRLGNECQSQGEIVLEQELHQAYLELQLIREEMQTSQEEIKSTNEELQSSNEELQSTIEELTTSKEENESINEELHTVNAELQSKLEEYSNRNNEMKNFLNSTEIATVILDKKLILQRFTDQARKIIKLIPRDVGRPITDIASDLMYDDMPEDSREVIKSNRFIEKQMPTYDGRWFLVRIIPYKSQDSIVEGVVITFLDISASKILEKELREREARYFDLYNKARNSKLELQRNIIENIETPVFSIDNTYFYISFNKNYATLMENLYQREIKVGDKFLAFSLAVDKDMKENINMALTGETKVSYLYIEKDKKDRKCFEIFYNPIWDKDGSVSGVTVFSIDVSNEKGKIKKAK